MTRADAAQLANHSASTISSLAHRHLDAPHPSDTPAPRTDILPPPLKPPATPLCGPLIVSTMLKKLPLSSAADHGGWRYEHLKWAFSLDSGRSRPSDAQDSLGCFIFCRRSRSPCHDRPDPLCIQWWHPAPMPFMVFGRASYRSPSRKVILPPTGSVHGHGP